MTAFSGVLLAFLIVAAPVPAPTQPPSTRRSPQDEKKLEMLTAEAEVAGLPIRKVDSIDGVIQFSRRGDSLVVSSKLDDIDELTRLLVRGARGVLTIRLGAPVVAGDPLPRDFHFLQRDLISPETLEADTTVSLAGGRLMLARDSESESLTSNIQLIQAPPMTNADPNEPAVKLYINRRNLQSDKVEVDLKLEAASFAQLCIDHPTEVETYLRPILRDFKQDVAVFAPDPKAAWQVLIDDFTPDAATVERVNTAATKLDAEDFHDREAALITLQDLGQPAALVLMKADRSTMSPEKQSNVDTFLAPYLPLSADAAEHLRQSPVFLLDCLNLDDPTLRALAWKRLQAVAHVQDRFDPNADVATRVAAVGRLRASLRARTSATAPAQP